jgi:hypothetical protein
MTPRKAESQIAEEKNPKKYGRKICFLAFGRIWKWPNLNRPIVQMADGFPCGQQGDQKLTSNNLLSRGTTRLGWRSVSRIGSSCFWNYSFGRIWKDRISRRADNDRNQLKWTETSACEWYNAILFYTVQAINWDYNFYFVSW